MKNTILVIAILVSIGTCVLAYYHNQTAFAAKDELNRERYSRMTIEEDLLKATEKVAALKKQLDAVKVQMENNEKLLKQTADLNSSLQDRLDKETQAKKDLEQKLSDLSQRSGANLNTGGS